MLTRSYLLPEWSPVKFVLLAWPYPGGDWQNNIQEAQQCYRGILKTFAEHVDVKLLVLPTLEDQALREFCREQKLERVEIVSLPYDDTWLRDYGPLSLSDQYIAFTFNGWGGKYAAENDNAVAQGLEAILGACKKYSFVCEGGALETNGETLLANADCVVDEKRNAHMSLEQVEDALKTSLGVIDIEWIKEVGLSGDDTDGHIDTIVRFAGMKTLLYSGRNLFHADADALESLHQQVQDICARRGWKAFELPTPEIRSKIDGRVLPATYANFLVVNQHVFVPVYGVETDDLAVECISRAFAQEFERMSCIPVRCEALLEQHGSLHCATMQIAKT